jgi:hypothetical protein
VTAAINLPHSFHTVSGGPGTAGVITSRLDDCFQWVATIVDANRITGDSNAAQIQSVLSQHTAAIASLQAQTYNALPSTGGTVTGPVLLQASQSPTAQGSAFATLDTVDAKIAAALAAYGGTGTSLTVSTYPVIGVQGGGSAVVGAVIELSTDVAWSTTPDSSSRTWLADGSAPAGPNTGTTYTLLTADVGKTITCRYEANMTGEPAIVAPSNGILVVAPAAPVLITPPSLTESPSNTFTIVPGVWSQTVTQSYQVYVNDVMVKSGSGANQYVASANEIGYNIFIRTIPSYGGNQLAYVDTPLKRIHGSWTVLQTGLAVPSDTPAPDTPGAITVTDLGNNAWGLTVSSFDNSPTGILHFYWNASATGSPDTDNYIGSTAGTNLNVLFISADSSVYVRCDAENTAGYSGLSSFTQLVAQTPPAALDVFDWADPRILIWVRTSKTNVEIRDKANAAFPGGVWMGRQMAPEGSFGTGPDDPPDPLMGTDTNGTPTLIWGRGVAGSPQEGWFRHRLFNGMPLWTGDGTRLRCTVRGPIRNSTGFGIHDQGTEYWAGYGALIYDDCFAQVDQSEDWGLSCIGGWHHWGNATAPSGNSPFLFAVMNSNLLEARFLWDGRATVNGSANPYYQYLDTAPLGVDGSNDDNWDGRKKVKVVARTRAQVVGIPHFWVFKYKFSWDQRQSPYVTVWQQVGVDGTIEQLGTWNIPVGYCEPDTNHDVYGGNPSMHYWHPAIIGGTTRSMDSPGYLLIKDDGTITAQQMFDSLTADIPRSAPPGGSGGSSGTITVDNVYDTYSTTISAATTDTWHATVSSTPTNFTAGKTGILAIDYWQTEGSLISSVSIGGTAAVRDIQAPGPTGQFRYEVWRATNMAGGTDVVDVTTGAGTAGFICTYGVMQVDGLSMSSPVDTATLAYNSGTSAAPSITTATTHSQANELVLAGFVHADSTTATITEPVGWTLLFEEEDGVTKMPGGACYKIVSSTTQQTATYAMGGPTSVTWDSAIISYKAA